jgi:DNA polymerase-3 subunit gamma/tau
MRRLRVICEAEGIEVTDDALALIARRAEGSMRDALTLLDQVVAGTEGPHDAEGIARSLGIAGRALYFSIGEAIFAGDPRTAIQLLGTAYEDGQNLQEVAEELVTHLRNILVLTLGEGTEDLVDAVDSEREQMKGQAAQGRPVDILRMLQIAMDATSRMRRSPFPRVILEVALAEICLLPRAADLTILLRKLSRGEEAKPAPSLRPRTEATEQGSIPPAVVSSSLPSSATAAAGPDTPEGASQSLSQAGPELCSASESNASGAAEGDPWEEVVRRLRRSKPALAAALSGSHMIGEEGGFLLVRLTGEAAAFQKGALESSENRPALRKVVQEVFGRPLGWKVEVAAESEVQAAPPPAAGASPKKPKDAAYQPQARSNLADIKRIADRMDGEILGPT